MKARLALASPLALIAETQAITVTQIDQNDGLNWGVWLAMAMIFGLVGGIGYLLHSNRQLLRDQKTLNLLWRHVPDVLIEVDQTGRILALNQDFNESLTMEAVTGASIYDYLGNADQALFRHHLQAALHTGNIEHYQLHSKKYLQGGFYRQQIVPFYLDDEARALVITTDVSEHKEAERILYQAKRQAEENARNKVQFMAKMSHEIRTPLGAISNMVDIIEKVYNSDEMHQYSQPLKTSVKHLERIMDDVKELAKAEGEQFNLQQSDVSLWNMLDDLEALYTTQAQEKGIRLFTHTDDDVPRMVNVDGFRLRQILYNLLNNAMTFTQEGSINVTLSRTQVAGKAYIKATIKDTGLGILPSRLDHIFDEDSKQDSNLDRGLGLAICRDLVKTMGGVIGAESQEQMGSEFWFTFPLNLPAENDEVVEWSQGRIYLAINDGEKKGWFVRYFSCLGLGVSLIDDHEQIESGEHSLLISDFIQDAETTWFWWLGPEYELSDESALVLSSPYRREALYQRLRDYTLGVVSKRQPGRDSHKMEQMSENKGHLLLVEDNLTNQLVIRKTLEKLNYQVDIANNGEEGVEAYKQNPYQLVIMDIQMPIMDGIEASKCIRQITGPYVPIIALTANTVKEIEEACFAAGMDAYLNKPVDRQALQNTLESLMANHPVENPLQ